MSFRRELYFTWLTKHLLGTVVKKKNAIASHPQQEEKYTSEQRKSIKKGKSGQQAG